MDLTEQTKQLESHLDHLKTIYEEQTPPKNRRDYQFFSNVRQQTEPIFQLLELWEETALQTIKTERINVHPQQIISTKENMQLLLMHSFYKDVRRKRYMELNHSVQFIFDQLLRNI